MGLIMQNYDVIIESRTTARGRWRGFFRFSITTKYSEAENIYEN
jgi:hypothetical protein